MTVVPPPPRSKVKLRRSQRVVISIPITISADSAGRQLTEDTHTLVINAHGALIAFSGDLTLGQQFQLRNRLTTEELACKIVHVGPKVEGKTQVGVVAALSGGGSLSRILGSDCRKMGSLRPGPKSTRR